MHNKITVYVGKADKDISRNIKLNIELQGSLPFISLSQSTGPGLTTDDIPDAGANYNCAIAKFDITKNPPKNILVDVDDADRFKFIAVLASYFQSIVMDVYYDSKYKRMFCIPSLVDMGDTALTEDFMRNQIVTIYGYGLGVSGGVEINDKCIAPYNYCALSSEPNEVDTILRTLRIPGKTGGYANNQGIALGGGDIYLEGSKVLPSEFVSIGSTATLGTKVPAYRYIRVAINAMHVYYVGEVDLDDVLIVMPI